jgi:hypothetical protein
VVVAAIPSHAFLVVPPHFVLLVQELVRFAPRLNAKLYPKVVFTQDSVVYALRIPTV